MRQGTGNVHGERGASSKFIAYDGLLNACRWQLWEHYDWVQTPLRAPDQILTPVRSGRRSGTDRVCPSERPLFIALPLYAAN